MTRRLNAVLIDGTVLPVVAWHEDIPLILVDGMIEHAVDLEIERYELDETVDSAAGGTRARALALLRDSGSLKNHAVAEALGVTPQTTHHALTSLVRSGVVQKHGTLYRIADPHGTVRKWSPEVAFERMETVESEVPPVNAEMIIEFLDREGGTHTAGGIAKEIGSIRAEVVEVISEYSGDEIRKSGDYYYHKRLAP